MDVELKIKLALPDDCRSFSDGELAQLLFDEYVNFATCSHLDAAVKWCGKAGIETPQEDSTMKLIYEMHKTWGEICGQAEWSFTREEE
jgi:hypothetical protein